MPPSASEGLLIAIPTCDERENIGSLPRAFHALHPGAHVLGVEILFHCQRGGWKLRS